MKLRNLLVTTGLLVTMTASAAEIREPRAPADPTQYVRVAVLQWSPPPAPVGVTAAVAEKHKARNRDALAQYAQQAAATGAKMVIFPEFGIVGYPDVPELPPEDDEFRNREEVRPYVEPINGATVKYFSKVAKTLGIVIHVGFAEVDTTTQAYYNTTAVIGANGSLITSYRKINLYAGERHFLSAGNRTVTYVSPVGLMGLATCSDIYSSGVLSDFRAARVAAIGLGMSWASGGGPMGSVKSAASSLKTYVLFSNNDYFPGTGVADPSGKFQSLIVQENGLAYGYLPKPGSKKK